MESLPLFPGKRGPRTTPAPDADGKRPFRAPRPRNPCPPEKHGKDEAGQPFFGVRCIHCGKCRAWRTDPAMGACGKTAVVGGAICLSHGGSVAVVRETAQRRLLELAAGPAMNRLVKLIKDDDLDPQVQLRAVVAAMDRGGLGPRQTIEHEAPAFEGFLGAVVRGEGAADRSSRYDRRTADIDDEDEEG